MTTKINTAVDDNARVNTPIKNQSQDTQEQIPRSPVKSK